MNLPDDFGLSPVETLAHVADLSIPSGFGPFWQTFAERVAAAEPVLRPATRDDLLVAGAEGVTHVFESVRGVRIGARLIEPEAGPPTGVVLTTHGYECDEPVDDNSPWRGGRLAVLKVRVRGFPGSQMDTGPTAAPRGGWIVHGLTDPAAWILPLAVADVVNAFRALRRQFGAGMPISLHGESFGGGLAVIAAAQLTPRDPPHRLAIGVPSLGDWPWRLRRARDARNGLGGEVNAFVKAHPSHAERIGQTLRLCDAALHARRVLCPVLGKLAQRDEVVPAPSAAAIYNALGTSPGGKRRFVTRLGHFDGGIADVRLHAHFERLAGEFLDPGHDLARFFSDLDAFSSDPKRVSA